MGVSVHFRVSHQALLWSVTLQRHSMVISIIMVTTTVISYNIKIIDTDYLITMTQL